MRQGGLICTCSRPWSRALQEKKKKKRNPGAPKTHPLDDAFFFVLETPYGHSRPATRKCDMSDMPSVQPTEQSRTPPPGSRESEHMTRHPACGCLLECSVSREMAVLSKLDKFLRLDSSRISSAWAMSYFPDQLAP